MAGCNGGETADRRAVEYAKCSADVAYFIDSCLTIDDAQGHGDGGGTMPFRLWPAQVQVAWTIQAEKRTIILKARQLGISWLCCGYALWTCLFAPGKVVLLFSQGELEANELLRRIRALYERLPAWLRDACPLAREPNTSEIAWANGSMARSLPATQKAGRSFTASLVVLDEGAHIPWANQLYTAMKPTIDGGGRLIVLSSANGIGNLFHRLWIGASQGLNGFRPIFLPWHARPGRDPAWYARQVAESSDPKLVKQEYPATATEAFLVSGRTRFDPAWIEAQAPNVRDPIPAADLSPELRAIPGLKVFAPTVPGHGRRLLISADVAEGLEHGDFSDAVVLDRDTWEELATLHGHWEADEFGRLLSDLADALEVARIVVERNNHGHTTLATLRALCPHRVATGPDGRPGWLTNSQTKPQAIDALAEALRDALATLRDAAALDELRIYSVGPDGKTSAPAGYHDDRVMSRAIALGWLRLVGSAGGSFSTDLLDDWRG